MKAKRVYWRISALLLAIVLAAVGCGGTPAGESSTPVTDTTTGGGDTTTAGVAGGEDTTTSADATDTTVGVEAGSTTATTGGQKPTTTAKVTTTAKPVDTNAFKNPLKNTVSGKFGTDPLKIADKTYSEDKRAQFHYNPKYGWGNDPNGLVYYEGEWHLFYQHNPTSNYFGYCYWGHAVSKDLIHWEELEPALAPTEKYNIWSGSCVVDKNDTTGFFDGGSGLVAMFTYADAKSNQCQGIAYSKDKGRTWTMVEEPVLYTDTPEDPSFRDPKVFWHEETGKWVAIVAGGQVRIYSSPDMQNWTLESKNQIWTECPDLFPMKVKGSKETKWVLSLAGEGYVVGNFDGKTFTPIQEVKDKVSPDRYAAQTYNNTPDGRRILIEWFGNWTYGNELATMLPGNAVYTLPLELKLVKENGNYRMLRQPVKEIDSLRGEKVFSAKNGYVAAGSANLFAGINAKTLDVELTFRPADKEVIGFKFRAGTGEEVVVSYNCAKQKLYVDRSLTVSKPKIKSFVRKYNAELKPNANGEVELRIMLDWSGVEIFANDGTLVMSALILPDAEAEGVEFFVEDGKAQIVSLDAWRVKSIW